MCVQEFNTLFSRLDTFAYGNKITRQMIVMYKYIFIDLQSIKYRSTQVLCKHLPFIMAVYHSTKATL